MRMSNAGENGHQLKAAHGLLPGTQCSAIHGE